MSRPIEKILRELLPEHNAAPLPLPLVELTGSILAHSKLKAAGVSADQEAARLHVCAHIACDRLKTPLDLPQIHSRPPIPPRLYKKLYDHVAASVPSSSLATGAAPKTPRKNRFGNPLEARTPGSARTAASPRSMPSRSTPGRDAALAQFRTPTRRGRGAGGADGTDEGTPTKSTGRTARQRVVAHTDAGAGLAPWVQPTIRFLCSEMDNLYLAPSILAGIESIAAPGGKPVKDEWIQANIAALIGALYLYTVVQVHGLETGEATGVANFAQARSDIIALLLRAQDEVRIKEDGGRDATAVTPAAAWHGFAPIMTAKDLRDVMREVKDRRWLQADWFLLGLPDVVARKAADTSQAERVDNDGAEAEHESTHVQVCRPDTMFQDQYDFLSKSRVADYNIWKAGMLDRIRELERNAPEPMDIDERGG